MYNSDAKAEVKRLRNEVQVLRDELAKMKRTFEDILYNLDTDNFCSRFVKEQNDMRTAIEVTAEGIKSTVSKGDMEKYSTITQTAESIQNIVSKLTNLSESIAIPSLDKATDKSQIYVIRTTNESGNVTSETYYYFNDVTNKWEVLSGESLYTVFEQTAEGFELKGNVKVDGSCILTDTLTFNSEAKPIEVQYSVSGNKNWHYTFNSENDKFMRIKIGSEWSEPMKVVGTDGGEANITFSKINAVLGYLYKTVDNGVPTKVDGSYIYTPRVLGGEFYGGAYYAGLEEGYSAMESGGFTVKDKEGFTKIALGYDTAEYTYPYVILGAGTGHISSGAGCIYKLGKGLWIGDSSALEYTGECPGKATTPTDVHLLLPEATGIFIDFEKDKFYKYVKGVPTEL